MSHRVVCSAKASMFVVLGLLFLAVPAAPARALEQQAFTMEILVSGEPLSEHVGRGATYVQAIEEREYGIRLTNHTARRIAVALSVDGLNTIDAKTTSARASSKWILGPWETVVLDGWQTAGDTARRFFFTTEEQSYGAWLGKTSNLGLISAAVFHEKAPRKTAITPPRYKSRRDSGRSGERRESQAPAGREPSSRSKESRGADGDAIGEQEGRQDAPPTDAVDDLAATGIGREYTHEVRRVRFNAETTPASVLEIRYEYHDALVSLGVLPQPRPTWRERLERREGARGFQRDVFAPDPYSRR